MGLGDYISLEGVLPRVHARCKREAFAAIGEAAARLTGVSADQVAAALSERETLGSTGVGHGVAIPHGKIEGLSEITAILARLCEPIDFDALDDEPVDLLFVLLAPADATAAHLKALAKVSRLLREAEVRAALRGADTAEAMLAITATDSSHTNAA